MFIFLQIKDTLWVVQAAQQLTPELSKADDFNADRQKL